MDNLLKRLAALDTCAVSDAMDRHGICGTLLGLLQLSASKRICGRAITVQLGPDDGRTSTRRLCTAAVDSAGPGTVIVVAHEGRVDVAGWGGILSLGASMRQVEGVVIDGACRDLDESRELGLPVYARAAVPITARSRVIEYDWNISVVLAGITVAPSDLIIADASGVVSIPSGCAEQVIPTAELIAMKERSFAADVRAGKSVKEAMGIA
jgi:4-hydroxy-4-methyl-2-oxoglutarate aldolase